MSTWCHPRQWNNWHRNVLSCPPSAITNRITGIEYESICDNSGKLYDGLIMPWSHSTDCRHPVSSVHTTCPMWRLLCVRVNKQTDRPSTFAAINYDRCWPQSAAGFRGRVTRTQITGRRIETGDKTEWHCSYRCYRCIFKRLVAADYL